MDINYKELFEKYIQTFEYDKEFYFHRFLTLHNKLNYVKYEKFITWTEENKDVVNKILLKNKDINEENNLKYKEELDLVYKNRKYKLPTLEDMTTWVGFFDDSP